MEKEETTEAEFVGELPKEVMEFLSARRATYKEEINAGSHFNDVQADDISWTQMCLDGLEAAWQGKVDIDAMTKLVAATFRALGERRKLLLMPLGHPKDLGGIEVMGAFDDDNFGFAN